MTYADLLIHIDSFPTPTSDAAIGEAVDLTVGLGGKLTAIAAEVRFPVNNDSVANRLIGLSALAEDAEGRSASAGRGALASFATQAKAAGVFQAAIGMPIDHFAVADRIARAARTHDLCLIPYCGDDAGQVEVAQAVVFSSGRPILVFRSGQADGLAKGPDLAVIAWDGSRCAARAMADALPMLRRARRVRLLTVLNEKPDATPGVGEDARRHLQAHGVTADLETLDADGVGIGKVLDRYVSERTPDVLVMGAYGHSRAREFLLGGATTHMLRAPPCPVFQSH